MHGYTFEDADYILQLLSEKSEDVQLVFYLRACGYKQKEIAELIGVSKMAICKKLKKCEDLKKYMKMLI
jgi:predicted DNA-binding protein YlxM (UPF0122 family)